jgi:hypothetical protein
MDQQKVISVFAIECSREVSGEELLGMLEDCDSSEEWAVIQIKTLW